jgi:hypothetical protein
MTRRIAERVIAAPPVETPQDSLLLTEKQAARFLGVSLPFLRRGRSQGTTGCRTPTPPFVKLGGRVFYRRSDLIVWVDGLTAREVV